MEPTMRIKLSFRRGFTLVELLVVMREQSSNKCSCLGCLK
jgi:Prokaryotic N-terminal methylation motif